jgi:hypothetical protein
VRRPSRLRRIHRRYGYISRADRNLISAKTVKLKALNSMPHNFVHTSARCEVGGMNWPLR